MAQRAPESPPTGEEDDKKVYTAEESGHEGDGEEDGQAQFVTAPVAPPMEDYPVERVEAVYRKLDLRIIPGLLPPCLSLPLSCLYVHVCN